MFDALPDELAAIVLASVPWRDRLRCAAVCRSWERVLRGAHMWDDMLRSKSPVAHLRWMCTTGDLGTAQLIAEQFKITVEDIRAGEILRACPSCPKFMRWLAMTFELTAEDILVGNFLWGACTGGHLGFAQWLATTFNLTAEDARTQNVLYTTCANGHFELARWLVTTFKLTADDVPTSVLYVTCGGRHLEIAQWLTTTFELSAESDRPGYGHILVSAYAHDFIEVAAWLIATFGLTLDDFRGPHGDYLRLIGNLARSSTIEWIVRRHDISGWEDRSALVQGAARRSSSLEAVRHLHSVLGFTAEEQHLAKHYSSGATLEWLNATFGAS